VSRLLGAFVEVLASDLKFILAGFALANFR